MEINDYETFSEKEDPSTPSVSYFKQAQRSKSEVNLPRREEYVDEQRLNLTRQGLPLYQSHTLMIEDNGLIFGEVYKLSKSKAGKFFGKNPYL